mmetsp:Transcript_29808/g.48034  ORF Transcript_29808/g.48034 Transcript_29808/m.48034 type:complete len:727 (+) Transcript_29808:125-2305(+)
MATGGMIPLNQLGGGMRPPGGQWNSMDNSMGGGMQQPGMIPLGSLSGGGQGGMMPLSSLSSGMAPPNMSPPAMAPPNMAPPPGLPEMTPPPASAPPEDESRLAEVGKTGKDALDVLMPISIPEEADDARPVPRQIQCLENGTDIFRMFEVDPNKFDAKAAKKGYHKLAQYVHPDKIGRKPTPADEARFTKLKQAYTVIMDEQLRSVYRQHCFGIAGSGGTKAEGHADALAKALVLGRELRKMGEERAIVLHKASEVGWSQQQKDQDGRQMRGNERKHAYEFKLFAEISSSEDDEVELEKEQRGMSVEQILQKSPKYADSFLDKTKAILQDPKVSKAAAGGAFTMRDKPRVAEWLAESPKTIQKHLRKLRTSVKQMNWAMTSLLQNKDSPWRGLEVKAGLCEHGIIKMLELIRSGLAFGKFSEQHEEEFSKVLDSIHKLYMDLFEKRGQELLRGAINAELDVIYKLPESEGRLPDGSRVIIQDMVSRKDLNGRGGHITGWDYSLQRYTVELEREEKKLVNPTLPSNPDMLGAEDDFDADEDEEEQDKTELAIPKKLMVLRKNVQVDLEPSAKKLQQLVKDWNAWRKRARSVSATQDAEAVAAALGPPLESMANFMQEAASAVSTASACGKDGADLIADECREALSNARNLAAKLLGEEPEAPPAPPPLNQPAPQIVPVAPLDPAAQALKEAAEVAAAGIEIKPAKKRSRSKKKRSRSRKRRRRSSSS